MISKIIRTGGKEESKSAYILVYERQYKESL